MKIFYRSLLAHSVVLIIAIYLEYVAIGTFTQATEAQVHAYLYTTVLITGVWILNIFTPVGIFSLKPTIYISSACILKAILSQTIAIAIFIPSILFILINFLDGNIDLLSDIYLIGLFFGIAIIVFLFKRTFVISKVEKQLKFNVAPYSRNVFDLHLQQPFSPKLLELSEEFIETVEYLFSLNANRINAGSIIFCKSNGEPRIAISKAITRLEQNSYKCSLKFNMHCFTKYSFILSYFLWSIVSNKNRPKKPLKQIVKFWSTPWLSLSITRL